MSSLENTRYIESVKEDFDQAVAEERFVSAAEIIDNMRKKGFFNEANWLLGDLKKATALADVQAAADNLREWLDQRGLTLNDLKHDDAGNIIVFVDGVRTDVPNFNF